MKIFIMKNDFLLIECNEHNEFRTAASFKLFGLFINDVDVKIDTGCNYTTIPVRRLGMSCEEALAIKIVDSSNPLVRKQISFGVNDDDEKKENDKSLFRNKEYLKLKSITYLHTADDFMLSGINLGSQDVRVSFDRTGNILIGMDIIKQLDIHIGENIITGKEILIAKSKVTDSQDYIQALKDHFGLIKSIKK